MNVSASPYELTARADGRRRRGALVRVDFEEIGPGYADIHPWLEFDDEPLDQQLATFGETPLTVRSLALARADAEARAAGRSLFEGLTIPVSHASLPFGHSPVELQAATRAGFTHVKLKGWEFTRDEINLFRESGLRFRLDFNGRPSCDEARRRLQSWGNLDWIDWIEDPCPHSTESWNELRERFKIRLALDFEDGDEGFDVFIHKPARTDPAAAPIQFPVAYTSYLDHPIGQLGAAWEAARRSPDEICGLATHEVYEPTEFSRPLRIEGGRLIPPGGPGIGFGTELKALEWQPL